MLDDFLVLKGPEKEFWKISQNKFQREKFQQQNFQTKNFCKNISKKKFRQKISENISNASLRGLHGLGARSGPKPAKRAVS